MAQPSVLPIELPRIGTDPLRVVLADDDPDIRNLLAYRLTAAGYEVRTATNGRRALALIEQSLPDVVILDVSMPGVSGVDVCRSLRAGMRTQSVPIVMLTGRTHVKDEYDGLRAGADLYLTKPVSPQVLLARIGDLLSYTRA